MQPALKGAFQVSCSLLHSQDCLQLVLLAACSVVWRRLHWLPSEVVAGGTALYCGQALSGHIGASGGLLVGRSQSVTKEGSGPGHPCNHGDSHPQDGGQPLSSCLAPEAVPTSVLYHLSTNASLGLPCPHLSGEQQGLKNDPRYRVTVCSLTFLLRGICCPHLCDMEENLPIVRMTT